MAVLKDVVARPSRQSEDDFAHLLAQAQERTLRRRAAASKSSSPPPPPPALTDDHLRAHADRTAFHLRLAEVVRDKSAEAAAVFMTLPLPSGDTPAPLYLAWLDVISRGMPPFLFVRGNQESVLTFYS